MDINLKGRSFLTLKDFTQEEIRYLLDLAVELKHRRQKGIKGELLKGKSILLIFEKTSTRTRCSFEVGGMEEGAAVTTIEPGVSQFGKKESIEDSAKVFGRYYDGIQYRGFEQSTAEVLAKYSGVPVWNGLTNVDHPTQVLADIMTIEEHVDKPLSEVKLVFCGDTRNNMTYAWMNGCAKMGMKFYAYGPKELAPDPEFLAIAKKTATETGAIIEFSSDVSCLKGADAVYTDVWASMGEESLIPERVKLLSPYKVTTELMEKTENPRTLFLHCLPSFHNFNTEMAAKQRELGYDIREVEDDVFDGRNSVVFDEAENRLHTIKALMVATLTDGLAGSTKAVSSAADEL